MSQVEKHFDQVAPDYDYYKKKNWYYYSNLKKMYQVVIPFKSKVLDIGCGTGDILAALNPRDGLGLDISGEMIARAKEKYRGHKNLRFVSGTLQDNYTTLVRDNWDFIIMTDVLEHLENPELYLKLSATISRANTKLMISMANPLWEVALLLLEKLKLKMPEGPHQRLSLKKTEKIIRLAGWAIEQKGYRMILPAPLPKIANLVNSIFYKVPLLKNLGLTVFYVCRRPR